MLDFASVVLASASPRRRQLLETLFAQFLVFPAPDDEQAPALPPPQLPLFLAQKKCRAVAGRFPDSLVIGADTIVAAQGEILGKPKDRADAARMLRMLSGQTHTVYTGVCCTYHGFSRSFCEGTEVEFYPLTEEEIDWYLDTGEPFDKAGAYGIQGYGATLVKRICGDFYNVMGLPVARLKKELQNLN